MSILRRLAFLFALAAGFGGWASSASAGAVCVDGTTNTCTVSNPTSAPTTLAESYSLSSGTASDSFFSSGGYWGTNVGGQPQESSTLYNTTGLVATFTPGKGPSSYGTVTLTFSTGFAQTCASSCGISNVSGNLNVYAADIFIESGSSASANPSATQGFNFAISLGYTKTADGGLSEGLYAGTYGNGSTSDKTSTQIWGGSSSQNNPGFGGYYGGAFGTSQQCSGSPLSCDVAVQSPTVADAGTAVAGISVSEAWDYSASNPSNDALTVTLNATTAAGGSELASIFSDFDIFWGTGDCSNAPIWGNVAGLTAAVPEPSSLALLLTAAIGYVFIRRRKRLTSRVA